jgi:hypothetical protein
MGAQRAQECVAITSLDFASMIYQVQFEVSTYERWVLGHDMRSALQWHRRFLQVLQWVSATSLAYSTYSSGIPGCTVCADSQGPRQGAGFNEQPHCHLAQSGK